MKERPILFSGPMIRALIAGRKTQTRRVMKPQPHPAFLARGLVGAVPQWPAQDGVRFFMADGMSELVRCPFGAPGDRLWVKETGWFDVRAPQEVVIYDASPGRHKYQSKGTVEDCEPLITIPYLEEHEFWKRRPSIFMRRWMSRITLELTAVRVERLQDITDADARAEGCCGVACTQFGRPNYRYVWEEINGAGSWAVNPWVWVIAFRRVQT